MGLVTTSLLSRVFPGTPPDIPFLGRLQSTPQKLAEPPPHSELRCKSRDQCF